MNKFSTKKFWIIFAIIFVILSVLLISTMTAPALYVMEVIAVVASWQVAAKYS